MLTKLKGTAETLAVLIELRRVDRGWERLTIPLGQFGLGIPSIDLRWATVHKQKDDPLSFGREVQSLGSFYG